jgi:signal transduction histidine kinase
VREFHPVPPVLAEKARVLQILVNLIRNAKHATDDGRTPDKIVILRLEPGAAGRVRLVVEDNGIGIPPGNLEKIFVHGFTTRSDGHGFGLHSSLTAAREMKGNLSVHSDGIGKGATFTLELPAAAADTPDRDPAAGFD